MLVEEELRRLASVEEQELVVDEKEPGTTFASFGAIFVRGEDRDIAVLRLANTLLDDARLRPLVTGSLIQIIGMPVEQGLRHE